MKMQYTFKGNNIEIGDQLKEKVSKKFHKLEKFFGEDTVAHITFTEVGKEMKVEITIYYMHVTCRAEALTHDLSISLDRTVEQIERQIIKNRTRLQKRWKGSSSHMERVDAWDALSESEENADEHEHVIIKSKKISMKPMDIEEAMLQLDLVGHDFFLFENANTNETSVVYKRRDGGYGLLEKE
jgi:putative sigma-54 modulation protein